MLVPDYASPLAELLRGTPSPRDYSQTERRLLDAALALLAEHAERRLTSDDIAAAAKVGRGSIFRCFGSKDALIVEVYEREVRRTVNEVHNACADATGAGDALVKAFEALQSIFTSHAVVQRLARTEPDRLVELCRAGELSGIELIRALLTSLALEAAGSTPVDSDGLSAAVSILSELHFAHLFLAPPVTDRGRHAGIVRHIVAACLAGVPSEPGPAADFSDGTDASESVDDGPSRSRNSTNTSSARRTTD